MMGGMTPINESEKELVRERMEKERVEPGSITQCLQLYRVNRAFNINSGVAQKPKKVVFVQD